MNFFLKPMHSFQIRGLFSKFEKSMVNAVNYGCQSFNGQLMPELVRSTERGSFFYRAIERSDRLCYMGQPNDLARGRRLAKVAHKAPTKRTRYNEGVPISLFLRERGNARWRGGRVGPAQARERPEPRFPRFLMFSDFVFWFIFVFYYYTLYLQNIEQVFQNVEKIFKKMLIMYIKMLMKQSK